MSCYYSVCSLYRIISHYIKISLLIFAIVVLFTTVQDLSELPDNVKVRDLKIERSALFVLVIETFSKAT